MFRIGDKVAHVDYPGKVGRVVAKLSKTFGGVVLVLWDNDSPLRQIGATSRHIPSALRHV
jgi:hypothetical protein